MRDLVSELARKIGECPCGRLTVGDIEYSLREAGLERLIQAAEGVPHTVKYVKGAGFGGSTGKFCIDACSRCRINTALAAFEEAVRKA